MASLDSDRVKLEDLTEIQAEFALNTYGYSGLAKALKDEGILNGANIIDLDHYTLTTELDVKSLQAKAFLKWIKKYTDIGFLKEDVSKSSNDDNSPNNPCLSPKQTNFPVNISKINITEYIDRNENDLDEIINLSKEVRDNKGLRILQFPSPGDSLSKFTSIDKTSINVDVKSNLRFNENTRSPGNHFKHIYPIEENVHPIEWNDDNCKRIVILGQTGVGKSTLINAMVNFAVGIRINDVTRFEIVIDPRENASDQTKSQTSEITRYRILDHGLGYKLELWDTPGFGDTRGISFDRQIGEQINQLINLEESCHAICFVVKASESRLTQTQLYIINSVLSFFSTEAKENVFALITHTDDSEPPVLEALKDAKNNFPYSEANCFAFNNSALFKPESERSHYSYECWANGMEALSRFFKQISNRTPFSLKASKKVIQMRCRLSDEVPRLYEKIADSSIARIELQSKYSAMKQHQHEIEKTGHFEVQRTRKKEVWDKWLIFWRKKVVYYLVSEVDHDLKIRYEAAKDKKQTVQDYINEHSIKVNEENEKMVNLLADIIDNIITLKEIAFVKSAWSMTDYLDILIKGADEVQDIKLSQEYRNLKNKQKDFEDIAFMAEAKRFTKSQILEMLRKWQEDKMNPELPSDLENKN